MAYDQDSLQNDNERDNATPGNGLAPGSQSLYDAVAQLYRTALGREGSPQDINAWIAGTGGDYVKIQQGIYDSPEAKTYGSRNAQAPKQTETPNPAPPPAPNPSPGGGGNTGTPGLTPGLTVPTPTFTPPAYTPPPAFSYADFVAPSGDELNSDPLYKYSLKTQQDAIQKSAAARGVLNTGGTIYDLLSNANDIASSAYGSLFNRNLSTYQTNRGNALDQYNTNYGTQYKDPYQYNYMGAQDSFNSNVHASDLANSYGWASRLFDWNKDQDIFNRKLGLLPYA